MIRRFRAARYALAVVVTLASLAGCNRSRTESESPNGCADGRRCLEEAQSRVRAYFQGRPSPSDAAEIAALFQRGCDLGSVTACETLAAFLDHGELVPADLPRAVHLYERACTLQNVNACSHLSDLYNDGRGVPKDAMLARKYRQLACGLADSMTRDTFCQWDKHNPVDGGA